jgi:transposase
MLKIKIQESDIQILREERFTHPPPRVMKKMEVLLLKINGISNEQICQITNICGNTLREYIKQYNEGGIERIKEVNFYRPSSELKEFSKSIEDYFTDNPPVSILQASAKIEEITGIKRGETQTRKYLKSLNFRYIKTNSVPAKALTEEKKTNKENFWKKNSPPNYRKQKKENVWFIL